MEKPNASFRSTFIPRPQFQNRSVIPERTMDSSIVDKLFLLFQEGQISRIKDYIVTNNITPNVVNADGETILHLVLKNESLSKYDKRELTNFLDSIGALSTSYDKSFVTPLHLAARHQLSEVVDILIKHKHSINATDVQYNTPLHYAVPGDSIQCEKHEKKSLIPIEPAKTSENFKSLLTELLNYINRDETVNMYMSHIRSTLNNVGEIFQPEINTRLSSINNDLNKIISESSLPETTQRDRIMAVLTQAKTSVVDFINSKLSNTLTPMIITNNLVDGWGPDTYQYNRILETINVEEFKTKLTVEIRNKTNEIKDAYVFNTTKLYTDINGLMRFCSETLMNLTNIIYFNSLIKSIGPGSEFTLAELENMYQEKNGNMLNITGVFRDTECNMIDDQCKDNLDPSGSRVPLLQTFIVGMLNGPIPASPDPSNPLYPKITVSHLLNGYFFNKKMYYLVYFLRLIIDTTSNAIVDIQSDIDASNFITVYKEHIADLSYSLANMIMMIVDIKDKSVASDTNLAIMLSKFKEKMGNTYNPRIKKILSDCIDLINDMTEKNEQCRLKLNNMYNNVRNLRDVVNNLIDLLNMKSSVEYIIKYSNDLIDFDAIVASKQTSQLEKTLVSRIENLSQFPASLDEYIKTINPDKTAQRKKMLEMYNVQITTKNYPTFLTGNSVNATIGFLTTENLTKMFGGTLPSLRFGADANSLPNLLSADPTTHVGNVGENPFAQYNKIDAAKPIVASYIDDHFNIIKYIIVRYLIQKLYDIIVSTAPVAPVDKTISDILNRIKTQIEKTTGGAPEDVGMLLVMIATSIDNIVIANIKDAVTGSANLISYNETIARESTLRKYQTTINSLLSSRPLVGPTRELKVDIEGVNSKLIEIYNTNATNLPQSYEDVVFIEPIKKDIFVVKGFDLFTRSNDSCYKFDSDVMEQLIRAGANINAKNRDGNSPIFDAIAIGNKNAVDILLKSGAVVYNSRSNNRNGFSAFKHSLNLLKFVIKAVIDGDFIGDTTGLVNEEIMKKTQYKSNMRYNEIILRMTMYLLNHQLFLLGSGYPMDWTYDKNKRLNDIIGTLTHPLPLLSTALDNIGVGTLDILNDEIQKKKEDIIGKETTVTRYMKSIQNLNLERTDILAKSDKTDADNFRLQQIDDKISELKKKSTLIENSKKQKMLDAVEERLKKDVLKTASAFQSKLKHFKYTNDVVDIYNSVFTRIINGNIKTYPFSTDLRTYPNVWKTFFKSDVLRNDRTQGIVTIMKKVNELIDTADPNAISIDFTLFSDFSENVLDRFINDYFDLPNEYNKTTNYALEKVMDIIIHITKHTMCVNLYHVILKLIKNHVVELNPMGSHYSTINNYNKFIEETVKGIIITSGTGKSNSEKDSKFIEYIMSVISEKAVKSSLNIYEHDADPDKDVNLLAYFAEINKRLMSNTVTFIAESSPIIKSLNDYVYPYFKDYMEIYIKHMKQMIDNYLKCLYTYGVYLKIVGNVAIKASAEKKLSI